MSNNISLTELKGLSKPATKLIESIGKAIGVVYEPTRIRREAKAKADALLILAESEKEVKDIAERASRRLVNRELREQKNVESIVQKSFLELCENVSDDPVNEDWIYRFLSYCEDISNEELQILWAKILAGEVERPGTFSLRTMHIISMLQQHEANMFSFVCNYMWNHSGWFYIFLTQDVNKFLREKGLKPGHFKILEMIGLLKTTELPNFQFSDIPKDLTYFGRKFQFIYQQEKEEGKGGFMNIKLPGEGFILTYILTDVGNELAKISGAEPDSEYLEILIKSVKEERKINIDEIL